MKRILITGGSGFIGTNLITYLQKRGEQVLNISNVPPLNLSQKVFWQPADILDKPTLQHIFSQFRPQWLIHLAARTDCDETTTVETGYTVNTVGTANVLEAVSSCFSIERVLVTSSQYVCRPGYIPANSEDYCPHTVYGQSKVKTEQLTREAKLQCPWVIVRPTNIWGPWHMRYRRQIWGIIQKGLYVHPGGKPVIRSYGYVKNVVEQMIGLLESPTSATNGQVFYLGDPPMDLYKWVNGFSLLLCGKPVRKVPRFVLRMMALIGDLIGAITKREFFIHSSRYRSMVTSDPLPLDAITRLLGPPNIALEQAIDETVQWLCDYNGNDGLYFRRKQNV